jgi:uncharacterized membrane protein HdeD (DUF308 family)
MLTHISEGRSIAFGSQLLLGLVLLVTPWLAGYAAAPTAAWSAWITGVAIAVVAAVGLRMTSAARGAAWVNLVLGLWALIAPWLLGFAPVTSAMWSHVLLGALTAIAAAAELWMEHRAPPHVHA